MQKLNKMRADQAGFTLVEIAVVMVIIGILIGGVLKGQAMIQNAKVKRVIKQADEYRAVIMSFYDKYGSFPGDENNANIPPGDTVNGDGDGLMEYAERFDLFTDLMEAELISGNYTGANVATHVFGGNVQTYWPIRPDHREPPTIFDLITFPGMFVRKSIPSMMTAYTTPAALWPTRITLKPLHRWHSSFYHFNLL